MSYSLLTCLDLFGADRTKELLEIAAESSKIPTDGFLEHIASGVINELWAELRDTCTSSCKRVSTDPITLRKDQIKAYWRRLELPKAGSSDEESNNRVLTIETYKDPCDLGLRLDADTLCPYTRGKGDPPIPLIDQLKQMELTIKIKKNRKPD